MIWGSFTAYLAAELYFTMIRHFEPAGMLS